MVIMRPANLSFYIKKTANLRNKKVINETQMRFLSNFLIETFEYRSILFEICGFGIAFDKGKPVLLCP